MNILVVGDLILDQFCFFDSNRISPEAPVPVGRKLNDNFYLGGAGNVAYQLSKFGSKVTLLSSVGNDESGKKILNLLKQTNIKKKIIIKNSQKTTLKKRIFVNGHCIFREDYDSIIECDFSKINFLSNLIKQHDLVIISDYNKGFCTRVSKIIELSNLNKIKVLVDPKTKDLNRYYNSEGIFPNMQEFKNFFSDKEYQINKINLLAKKIIKKYKFKFVVITLGSQGSLYIDLKKMIKTEAMAADATDVTGAGDNFISTFAFFYKSDYKIDDILKYSNKSGSIAVSNIGLNHVSLCSIDDSLKFRDINSIVNIRKANKNKKVLLTNGCFDLVHLGHINFLKKCKEKSDIMILAINSDESVRKLKGSSRPIHKLSDRVNFLKELSFIDYIVEFNEQTPIKIINKIRPDILAKGNGYSIKNIVGAEEVRSWGGKTIILKTNIDKSTTNIIRLIDKKNNQN